jgi:hypothetical protein
MWPTLTQSRRFQQNPAKFEPAVAYFQFVEFKRFPGAIESNDDIAEQHYRPNGPNDMLMRFRRRVIHDYQILFAL